MPDSQFRILIFEDWDEHRKHLKKILNAPGCELAFEDNLYQATQRFKNAPFDLSIVSLDMADEEGEELALWLIERYPRRSVILTGTELIKEQNELLAYKSVVGFFEAPLSPDVLSGILNESDRGLRGQVQRMQILDLLQAMRYSQKYILLHFSDASLQQDAVVHIQDAEVVNVEIYQRNVAAQSRELLATGTEAFDLLLAFRNGTFTEQVWQAPAERTIMIPFDGLMMNAAQRRDEGMDTSDTGPKVRSALLIDDDAMSRMLLQRSLLTEGIDCQSIRSLGAVISSFEAQNADLLILDSSLPQKDVSSCLSWLKNNAPDCRVLVLGQAHWSDKMPIPYSVLERPISPKRLKEVLFELTQVGFRGYLSRIGVLEFLQLNLSAIDEAKKLHIRDLETRVDGQIFINQGRFIHAVFDNLVGEEAFYRIASIEKGDFFEDPAFDCPAESLGDILPHKLMINAGRFVKPLEEPEAASTEMSSDSHLEGVADKMAASASEQSFGELNLFGDDEEIQLNLGDGPQAAGGVTSLFGDDEEIQINLGDGPQAAGGVTSLFGDDEEIQINLGDGPQAAGGVTSLFGDDEEIQINLGDGPQAAGGVTNLFGDDEEIQLNLGAEEKPVSVESKSALSEVSPRELFGQQIAESDDVPEIQRVGDTVDEVPPQAFKRIGDELEPTQASSKLNSEEISKKAAANNAKLEEMRARWEERRARLFNKKAPLAKSKPENKR